MKTTNVLSLKNVPLEDTEAVVDAVGRKLLGPCHNCQTPYVDNGFLAEGCADWGGQHLATVTCLKCKSSASVFIKKARAA